MTARRCHTAAPPRPAAGFSLLEVMVALALLAAALMALAELSGQALRNHAYARDLSTATLLARGKMVELEQRYEDQGFRDFDEKDEGDFSAEGRPSFRWQVELTQPEPSLSADSILAALTGAEDANDAIAKLFGSQEVPGSDGSATTQSPLAGLAGGMLQTQVTAFAETLKKSLRQMRLTVAWQDGRIPREVSVSTYLVVLNPRAPGGARGDNPDVPPNLAAPVAGGVAAGGLPGAAGLPGAIPGVTNQVPAFVQPPTPGSRPTPFRRPPRRNRPADE